MSEPPIDPTGSESKWTEDISSAFAAARDVALERRLEVFLVALSTKTLRLVASEPGPSARRREVLVDEPASDWADRLWASVD